MLKIFKYPLSRTTDLTQINLPKGAEILHVDVQDDRPQIWALIDSDLPAHETELRSFKLVGTGHEIDIPKDKLRFIGTFFLQGRAYVFHVFEVIK